jgi:hypothetical protein
MLKSPGPFFVPRPPNAERGKREEVAIVGIVNIPVYWGVVASLRGEQPSHRLFRTKPPAKTVWTGSFGGPFVGKFLEAVTMPLE